MKTHLLIIVVPIEVTPSSVAEYPSRVDALMAAYFQRELAGEWELEDTILTRTEGIQLPAPYYTDYLILTQGKDGNDAISTSMLICHHQYARQDHSHLALGDRGAVKINLWSMVRARMMVLSAVAERPQGGKPRIVYKLTEFTA